MIKVPSCKFQQNFAEWLTFSLSYQKSLLELCSCNILTHLQELCIISNIWERKLCEGLDHQMKRQVPHAEKRSKVDLTTLKLWMKKIISLHHTLRTWAIFQIFVSENLYLRNCTIMGEIVSERIFSSTLLCVLRGWMITLTFPIFSYFELLFFVQTFLIYSFICLVFHFLAHMRKT